MKHIVTLLAMVGLLPTPAAAQISPASWPAAERARLEQREAAMFPTGLRTVAGSAGLVSGTASPVAVHAGIEALRMGGTAADAAIATALTQVTTMAGANVSFAGVAELLYFDARTGRVHVLDAGWNGWRGERSPATIPTTDLHLITGQAAAGGGDAGRKTLVPGFMAGIGAMHRRFGRLAFRKLFAPSIWYARHGVPVTPLLSAYFHLAEANLKLTPEGRAFAYPDASHLPTAGQRFIVPGLAATLSAVARQGAAYMYRGAWARHYVATVRARGGAATMADMAAYRPRWTEPVTMDLAGGTLFAPDTANPSGCAITMALNLIDHSGSHAPYWEDAAAFRTLSEASALANAAPYLPSAILDAQIGRGSGCAAHTTAAWAAAAAPQLPTLFANTANMMAGHHSAAVVAVDRWGNVAALVHSSNTPIWGESGMVVDGVPIPLPAGLYQARLAKIAPGQRVPGDMAPVILLREGRPRLAIATIGTSLVSETVRLLLGLGHGGDLATWAAAPPPLLNVEQLVGRDEFVPKGRYAPELIASLRTMGMNVREVDAQRALTIRGTAALLMLHGKSSRSAEVPGVLTFAEGVQH